MQMSVRVRHAGRSRQAPACSAGTLRPMALQARAARQATG
jgi:hypothetical protein